MKWQRETTFPHHAVLRAVRELHCRRAEVSKPTTTKDDIRRCAEGQIPRRDHLPLIFRAVLVALLSAGHAGAPLEVDKAIALTRAEPRGVLECQPYKETPVFGVLSLCLSRTCLGKMIVSCKNGAKRYAFSLPVKRTCATPSPLNSVSSRGSTTLALLGPAPPFGSATATETRPPPWFTSAQSCGAAIAAAPTFSTSSGGPCS
jgi:hypothetical protein